MALALVLLVGAGLLLRSFVTLLRVDPGFDPSRTMTVKVSIPTVEVHRRGAAAGVLQSAVRAARRAARRDRRRRHELPADRRARRRDQLRDRREAEAPAGQEPVTDVRVIDPQLFQGDGRAAAARPRVRRAATPAAEIRRVIVNQTLASKHFPGEDPIGKSIIVVVERRGAGRDRRRRRRRAPAGSRDGGARDDLLAARRGSPIPS